ncbi:GBS Bsp-like repeat-containing protein [Lachnospiraceae bacterium 48-21]
MGKRRVISIFLMVAVLFTSFNVNLMAADLDTQNEGSGSTIGIGQDNVSGTDNLDVVDDQEGDTDNDDAGGAVENGVDAVDNGTGTEGENGNPDENQASPTAEESTDESVRLGSKEFFEYIYLDEKVVNLPGEQNVVLAAKDESMQIEAAGLEYVSEISGEVFSVEASAVVDNTVLFKMLFDENQGEDKFRLKSASIKTVGNPQAIYVDFQGDDVELDFAVTKAVEKTQDESGDGMEVNVYSIDENGNTVEKAGEAGDAAELVEDVLIDSDREAGNSFAAKRSLARNGNKIIVLCAGHDATHAGARGNGLKEEELTYKVARYCKEELEKYQGVTVYLDRESLSCAYPGSERGYCLNQRVTDAFRKGASVFVDLHFNTSNGSGNGVEVWTPNQSYSADIHWDGKNLADKIVKQLASLGLTNRGVKFRDATNGEKDPAGNVADFYTSIAASKQYGMTGIIVEHAFLDNASDAAKLKNEDFIKQLGIKDATGIANAYNLTKGGLLSIQQTSVENFDPVAGTFDVVMSGVRGQYGVQMVQAHLINPKGTSYWYNAQKQSEGVYKFTVNIKDCNNEEGRYYIQGHVWDLKGNVALGNMVSKEINTCPGITKTEIVNINGSAGTFDVVLSGVTAIKGVKNVCISSYVPGKATQWIEAVKQSEGVYKATVKVGDEGTYTIQGFARDRNGSLGSGKVVTKNISISKPSIGSTKIENYNADTGAFDVVLSGVAAGRGIGSVCVSAYVPGAVTQWYPAIEEADGVYRAKVESVRHNSIEGTYTVQGFVRDSFGTLGEGKVLTQKVSIKKPSIGSIRVENYKPNAGTADVILSEVTAPKGVGSVCISAYIAGTTTQWYTAYPQSDGTYKATVDISRHGNKEGTYTIQGFVRDTAGTLGESEIIKQQLSVTNPIVGNVKIENADSKEGTFDVVLSGVIAGRGVANVCISVYVPGTTTKWYTAVKQPQEGIYRAQVDIAQHKYKEGTYTIQGFARDVKGTLSPAKSTAFYFAKEMTPIMGVSNATASELAAFYGANTLIEFPSKALQEITLKEFCEMYCEEASAEGVRAEVAFAQAMLETGFLKYGGDVKIEQFNFAGLGATGGVPGNSFDDVRTGIRAHIQHLKCYASTEPLKNACVDPRWSAGLRGKAEYVEWLCISNNPNGAGWAADPNYAGKILSSINKLTK